MKLLKFLAAVLFSFLLCELIVRFVWDTGANVAYFEHEEKQASDRGLVGSLKWYLSLDPDRSFYYYTKGGWRMRPSTRVRIRPEDRSSVDVVYETNSLGLRGQEIFPTKNPRVLLIGDSVTFGIDLQEHYTFVRMIEKLSYRYRRPMQMINAGIVGNDLVSHLALLRELGPKLKPRVVVLNMFLNDFAPCCTIKSVRPPRVLQWSEFFLQSFHAYSTYNIPFEEIVSRWSAPIDEVKKWREDIKVTAQLAEPEQKAAYDRAFESYWDCGLVWSQMAWDYHFQYFVEFVEEVRALGADPVFVLFPDKFQSTFPASENFPQSQARAWAEAMNIRFVDLLPIFRKEKAPRALFNDDLHPSPAGSRVAARPIWEAIEEVFL